MSGDFSVAAWTRALAMTARISRAPAETFPARLDDLADTFGDATALISTDTSLTYRAAAGVASRYARWALREGLGRGDVVCLLMHNCVDYPPIWAGISRTGAVVALVNTSLAGDSLAHAIRVASPRHVIVGAGLLDTAASVQRSVGADVHWWSQGDLMDGFAPIEDAIRGVSSDRLAADECPRPALGDPALYIYTSGTTGLPKAAIITHGRVLQWCYWFAGLLDTSPADRMYDCLPMYHSVGGIVATGALLVAGGTVVIRPRFSSSQFWDDVVRERCTLFQYIGELCRFLVHAPTHPMERAHSLRLASGNGLRADVWSAFQKRFQIPRIVEFYAATEANFSLYNCEGKPGAIGRIPPFLPQRASVDVVRLDDVSGEPARGGDGHCIRCGPDEAGETVSRIRDDARFEGYTDSRASEQKILRDVFSDGDAWYRSGDLMRRDAAGFFYFVDRLGDTFRWKGENVSTVEVAEILMGAPGVIDATVFGVALPGTDGRAGMAALVTDEHFTLEGLIQWARERLPTFAQPLFVRLIAGIETTSTFKPVKRELARAGYDPSATTDAIYMRDRESFTRVDSATFDRLRAGLVRV
jgi:fatty-acyl-CoA synthase